MLHDFIVWVESQWGVGQTIFQRSFSDALEQSWNFWSLVEGTHVLTLMLFFGTIMMVDLRLMGLTFRQTPVSVLSERLLKLTVVAFLILVATGVLLFFAKAEDYYHNFWFRIKMILLVAAMINIYVFHKVVQKNQAEWDTAPSPPMKAKVSGLLSLAAWCVIIAAGRFVPYPDYHCGTPQPEWVNAFANCAESSKGAARLDGSIIGAEGY